MKGRLNQTRYSSRQIINKFSKIKDKKKSKNSHSKAQCGIQKSSIRLRADIYIFFFQETTTGEKTMGKYIQSLGVGERMERKQATKSTLYSIKLSFRTDTKAKLKMYCTPSN